MTEEQKQALIDEIVIQALRDDVRQWQQRAEAAEAESARLTRNYKHIIEQHMPRTSDGCDKGWTRVIEAHELQAKLEAAEAKLAELAKQKPYGYINPMADDTVQKEFGWGGFVTPVFTQPVPAADLAALVPDVEKWRSPEVVRAQMAYRALIMRKIEEAK